MIVIQKKYSLSIVINIFSTLFSNVFLLSYLQESPGSIESQCTFILPWLLGSDCLYPCVLDTLWVSQRQTVRPVTDAKFKSHREESHKLPSMQCWSGSMPISILIHCGFIAYLFLACGKHFPNNIYISHAQACGSFSSVLLVNTVFGLGMGRSEAPPHEDRY